MYVCSLSDSKVCSALVIENNINASKTRPKGAQNPPSLSQLLKNKYLAIPKIEAQDGNQDSLDFCISSASLFPWMNHLATHSI